MKFGMSEGMVLAASGDAPGIFLLRRTPARSRACASSDERAVSHPAKTEDLREENDRASIALRRPLRFYCHCNVASAQPQAAEADRKLFREIYRNWSRSTRPTLSATTRRRRKRWPRG